MIPIPNKIKDKFFCMVILPTFVGITVMIVNMIITLWKVLR